MDKEALKNLFESMRRERQTKLITGLTDENAAERFEEGYNLKLLHKLVIAYLDTFQRQG